MIDNRVSAYQKGWQGEDRACEYLAAKGMTLLERRFHSHFGEIDMVLMDGDTLVFAEVKLRIRAGEENAMGAVNARKRERIVQTAREYLGQHPTDAPARFDVVVVTPKGVTHIPNAFEGNEW